VSQPHNPSKARKISEAQDVLALGSGFEPHWRPQPAKLPSFGRYSLKTLPYLTLPWRCYERLP